MDWEMVWAIVVALLIFGVVAAFLGGWFTKKPL